MSGNGWDKPETVAAKLSEVASNVKVLSKQIDEMAAWTRTHETTEFNYHGRVEENMSLTREYIAGNRIAEKAMDQRVQILEAADSLLRASISQVDRDHSLRFSEFSSIIESRLQAIQNRIAWMMGGLGVVLLVVLPLATWVLYSVHQLDVKVQKNEVLIRESIAPQTGARSVFP